jgi:hypothetical protein
MLNRAREDKQEVARGFSEAEPRLQVVSSGELGFAEESG